MSSLLVVLFGFLFLTGYYGLFWKDSAVSSPLLASKRRTFTGDSEYGTDTIEHNIDTGLYTLEEFTSIFTSYSQYVHDVLQEFEYSVSLSNISMKKMQFKFSKRHAFIIHIFIILLRELWRKKGDTKPSKTTQTTKTKHRHRIVFGASGGLCVYQFGVFKAILEHFGTEISNQCVFEGLSGGAAVGVFSLACMYGYDTMNNIYTNALALPSYTARYKPLGMIWTTSNLLYKIMYDNIKKWVKHNGGQIPNWLWSDAKVSAWVTSFDVNNCFKNVLLSIDTLKCKASDIECIAKYYAMAAKTTTLVPLVLSPRVYCCIDGHKYGDGGIAMVLGDRTVFTTKNVHNEDCKVLYINMDLVNVPCLRRRYNEKKVENGNIVYYLDIWKWADFSVADYAIWGNKKYTDNLYQTGYDLAKKHMVEIETVFNDFLSFKEVQ